MADKKRNLMKLALGAASVGLAAAALAKGLPKLREKMMEKCMEKCKEMGGDASECCQQMMGKSAKAKPAKRRVRRKKK